MKLHKGLLLIWAIIIALALAACGNGSKKEEGNKEDADKQGGSSYKIEHAMGTTEIPDTPKRVVILTNEGTEALLALGVKPVGAVKSWVGDPWYKHISDQMEGVEVVGDESQVNVEAIAKLKPDLIIGNKMRQEAIYPQLEAIAPTVFAETLRGDWKENFKLYAKAVNKEDEGEKVIGDFDARIDGFKEKFADQLDKEISLVRFMAGDVRIYHKDTFAGVILNQIGFARPESQDVDDFAEKNVSTERIPAMDGDILFYFTYETGDGEAKTLEEEWLKNPLFKNLEAVKTGNIHKVNDSIWNTAGGVIAANLMLDDLEKIMEKAK
ncbi:iron-siderophore ABC transporter substrate-binding protein [Siminovitchia acidinfaciens]|uniref:Iron-siderophore ABC transporter substrate-binding protein n=1 Tax=Siminovitchia acidinfaciens TaxID=2321395 RepID=A0A429XZT3_9BACI|nr:iron-siderophore ABC transporter substrate-binding protein [Siminovitchia acidinfaciens]RST74296.1 iron-siderophore ABC transporter substrate-binding protein [Siminovitchia acidinfaciens]